ncbi:hypothetical protein D9M72_654570 [compost metagenome]
MAKGMNGSLPHFFPKGAAHDGDEGVVETIARIVLRLIREKIREERFVSKSLDRLIIFEEAQSNHFVGHG